MHTSGMMMQGGVTPVPEELGEETPRVDSGVIVKRETPEPSNKNENHPSPHEIWLRPADSITIDSKVELSSTEKINIEVEPPKVSVIQQHTSKKASSNRRKNNQQTPYKFHNWETPLDCTSNNNNDEINARIADIQGSLSIPQNIYKNMFKNKSPCETFSNSGQYNTESALSIVKKENEDPAHSSVHINEHLLPKLSLESLPNESIKHWLQRITAIQNEIIQKQQSQNCSAQFSGTSSVPNLPKESDSRKKSKSENILCPPVQLESPISSRIVSYRDLPYMGEMTLDNCKPRRGRKPKKADICHLIYKNYGTIVPGSPTTTTEMELQAQLQNSIDKCIELSTATNGKELPSKVDPSEQIVPRTDIQNRIISSLLERRLTQESKRKSDKDSAKTTNVDIKTKTKSQQDEPLNLCIRDLNQLKIRLLRRHDNVYESQNNEAVSPTSSIKSEPQSVDDDIEFLQEIKPSTSNSFAANSSTGTVSSPEVSPTPNSTVPDAIPEGFVFWPNAGVFVNPIALQSQMLQYKKLAENGNILLPSPRPSSTSSSTETPKQQSDIVQNSESSIEEQRSEPKAKRSTSTRTGAPPTKRKRSAIFIPPIPVENQNNPATEVSICKFKFTGGAKPCLQEKKMLSVDSGGNFRYYSGTGDKSMRGYEFFPRKVLQQHASNGHMSSSGVFLNASGEKISVTPPLDATSIIEARTDPLRMVDSLVMRAQQKQQHSDDSSSIAGTDASSARQRKRRTRKSLQREKLEQTFKEKGFLIQTQQLESAEGATYCKFRQLRKFTRYLFRSWKDYLPGNVRDMQAGADAVEAGEHSDDEIFAPMANVPSDIQERTPSV